MSLEFTNQIKIGTSMVQLYLFALQTQEVEIGVVLVLRHAEYLPPFKVKHNFPMTLILLKNTDELSRVKTRVVDSGSIDCKWRH